MKTLKIHELFSEAGLKCTSIIISILYCFPPYVCFFFHFYFWVAVCSWNLWIINPILLNELFTQIEIVGHLESCFYIKTKTHRLGIGITTLIPQPGLQWGRKRHTDVYQRWLRKVVVCISDGAVMTTSSELPSHLQLADAFLYECSSHCLCFFEQIPGAGPKFLVLKECSSIGTGCSVTIPKDVQGMWRCGTWLG